MKDVPTINIQGNEKRKQYLLKLVLLLLIGSAYVFGTINFYLEKPFLNGLFNIIFGVIFTILFWFREKSINLTILLGGILFQAFIFGHSYFLLPGKQIEAGFGLLTCILPIFVVGARLWFFFISNLILYHLVLFNANYENVFTFQYGFYVIVFIMVNAILKENQLYERELLLQRDKIKRDAESLRELDDLKNKFFANISHELRTPLTLMLSPIETILKSNELSNRNSTYMQLIQQNGQKLLKRINELLELSRLRENKLALILSPVNIYTFTKHITAMYEGAANMKSIQLNYINDLPENISLNLDSPKLEMIVSNYLSNAVKFTPEGGTISTHITKVEQQLQISVKDTGIGIPKNAFQHVFDRFYQVKSEDYHEGTGIGLALCKELAELHGGKVWVESEIGQGSTFYVQLPFEETIQPSANITSIIDDKEYEVHTSIATKAQTTEHKPTILVVEDNADLRKYMELLLSEQYNIVLTENGEEALKWLMEIKKNSSSSEEQRSVYTQPSLIISDIMLPIMDGMTLLKKLKTSDEFRHIPVIMLTAQKHTDTKIDALRIGVDDYLTKPFQTEELLARVNNLITNTTQRLQIASPTTSKTPQISESDIKWLASIEQKIIENLDNSQFKLSDLAKDLYITPRSLQQRIKKLTGQTPKKYQRSIKLHQARKLLKTGEIKTVSELSFQLGFEDQHYFSKLYKSEFGITPKAEISAFR